MRSATYSNSHTLIFSWPVPGSKIIGKAYRGNLCKKNTGEVGGRKIHVTVAGKHCSGMPGR